MRASASFGAPAPRPVRSDSCSWQPREALALQKPLPDGALRIVATGEKEDGLAA
jgi:hypothetical protein